MPLGDNPNMLVVPNISPPYPVWDQNKDYFLGDVVNWAGQNWLLFFYADNGTQIGNGYSPDLYPITLNSVPSSSPGIYVPVANPPVPANTNGGCWLNLTLATPPAPVWDEYKSYKPGDVVMYPVESPGSYWRCVAASLGDDGLTGSHPQLPGFIPGSAPPRISPEFWQPLNGAAIPSQLPAVGLNTARVPAPPGPTPPSPPPPPPTVPPLATFLGSSPDGNPVDIILTWTKPSGAVYSSYVLLLAPFAGDDSTEITINDGNILTYTFTDVAPASDFVALITPYLGETAGLSSSLDITSGSNPVVPTLTVTPYWNNDTIVIGANWTAVDGATAYDIYWSAINPTTSEAFFQRKTDGFTNWSSSSLYSLIGLGATVTITVLALGASENLLASGSGSVLLGTRDPYDGSIVSGNTEGSTSLTARFSWQQPVPLNPVNHWDLQMDVFAAGTTAVLIRRLENLDPTVVTTSLSASLTNVSFTTDIIVETGWAGFTAGNYICRIILHTSSLNYNAATDTEGVLDIPFTVVAL